MSEKSPRSSSSKPRLFSSKNQRTGPAIVAQFAATTHLVGASFGRSQSKTGTRHYPMALADRRHHLHQLQAPQDARLQPAATTRRRTIIRKRANETLDRRALGPATLSALFGCFKLVILITASLLLVNGGDSVVALADDSSAAAIARQQSVADNKAALEAELNSILQQQDLGQETNSKLLSETIISRLMLGNLTDIGTQEENASESGSLDLTTADNDSDTGATMLSTPDATRLRKMLSYLQNYEIAQAGLNGGQTFSQFPVLPASQAATIKRASMKMSNYLRQQAQHQHNGQRQLNGYGRVNSFDFGLGKRPDSSVSSNILRFGDSGSAGGHMAAVSGSGLGKRPSAHRYDFGLGKRVANPAYPRYDFGLGKRAPSRIRYDFGLGK